MILEARRSDKHLPVLLLQLLDQRIVDLRAHRREDSLVRDCAVKHLLDSCVDMMLAPSSVDIFPDLSRDCSPDDAHGVTIRLPRNLEDLPTAHGTPTSFAMAE